MWFSDLHHEREYEVLGDLGVAIRFVDVPDSPEPAPEASEARR